MPPGALDRVRRSASTHINSCIRHCSLIFEVFITNTTQHSDNTTQLSADNVRRYSTAGAKIKELWVGLVGAGEGGVANLRYYR
jgi:hypothetical protein